MATTRTLLPACIIFVITILLYTPCGYGQIDPKSIAGVWLFDEASGDVARDSSGNGYDADFKGNPSWVDGKYGHAVQFPGNSYLEIRNSSANLPFGGAAPFSITAWVKNQGGGTLMGKFNGGVIGAYIVVIEGSGTVTFHREVDPWTFSGTLAIPNDEFGHVAVTYDGTDMKIYINGQFDSKQARGPQNTDTVTPVLIGARFTNNAPSEFFTGVLDEVALFNIALSEQQIRDIMFGLTFVKASNPVPADGAYHEDTWVNLSWMAGGPAVSHDVYLGDSFDAVNDATTTSETFRGNQTSAFYVAGFPGFAYPDGLVPGTTYYWRIDEVNDANPDSPWKGDVWSFTIPPNTAYNPIPADGGGLSDLTAALKWTSGFGAKLHTVYFGGSFDDVSNAAGGLPQNATTYKPSSLESEKVYYWRVDEFSGLATHKGNIWGFSTAGAVGDPQPANGATDVPMTAQLAWMPATNATSHDLYFGTDKDAVRNATTASPEFMGNKALGSESYAPAGLALGTTYYWRVDAVYNSGPVKGLVWSFTASNFILIDDFESYNDIDPPDAASNRIFDKWIDGFGTTNNGALVGNEMPPYAEQIIVHGGIQSMPYLYDNNLKTSEATLTLVYPRDWTAEGVTKLSLWFRGIPVNSGEKMYVALNGGAAVVYHENPAVTQVRSWTKWVIDLQAFADQGVNLTNVNTITIGIGTKGSPIAGGTGTMYFDDIRLMR